MTGKEISQRLASWLASKYLRPTNLQEDGRPLWAAARNILGCGEEAARMWCEGMELDPEMLVSKNVVL